MSITATEFKMNLGKYLLMAASEDIYITRNGKTIAKLTAPYQDHLEIINFLYGSVPDTFTLEEVKEDRMNKI